METWIDALYAEFRRAAAAHPDHISTQGAPIGFFGSLSAYWERPEEHRVLTAGVNPGPSAFQDGFAKYPALTNGQPDEATYLMAMANYFDHCGVDLRWFGPMMAFLRGRLEVEGNPYTSGALHTDIHSPLATKEKWSELPSDVQDSLQTNGLALWKRMVGLLKPREIHVSVSAAHRAWLLGQLGAPDAEVWVWSTRTAHGRVRRWPWRVSRTAATIRGHETTLYFFPKAQGPFAGRAHAQLNTLGSWVREGHGDGHIEPDAEKALNPQSAWTQQDAQALIESCLENLDRDWTPRDAEGWVSYHLSELGRPFALYARTNGVISVTRPTAQAAATMEELGAFAGVEVQHLEEGTSWTRFNVSIQGELEEDQQSALVRVLTESLLQPS